MIFLDDNFLIRENTEKKNCLAMKCSLIWRRAKKKNMDVERGSKHRVIFLALTYSSDCKIILLTLLDLYIKLLGLYFANSDTEPYGIDIAMLYEGAGI